MSKPVNLTKIEKMEYLTFRNAVRLHLDSIHLFKTRSYPSSFFLSVLAQEELGKATILNDFVFHSQVDGRMGLEWEQKWLNMIYYHKIKQGAFQRNAMYDLPKYFITAMSSGKLEDLKQSSVYVGFQKRDKFNSRLSSPFSINRAKATKQISVVNDYLRVLSLGVSKKVYCWDNVRVERLLNLRLFKRLSALWKTMNHSAERLISKLQSV
jgi:AbiV family abortive infection protein